MNFSCLALTAILQFEFIEISLNYFQQASFAFIPPKYFGKSYHLNSKVWICVADPRIIVLAVHRKANNLQIWVGLKSKWWTQSTFLSSVILTPQTLSSLDQLMWLFQSNNSMDNYGSQQMRVLCCLLELWNCPFCQTFLCWVSSNHVLSRIYSCTKHGNRPIWQCNNCTFYTVHLDFTTAKNCDQLYVKICSVLSWNLIFSWVDYFLSRLSCVL